MSKKILKAQRRIEEIKNELMTIEAMRPGRLSPQKRKDKDGKYYGSYWQISYTHNNKSHSHYVPEQFIKQIKEQTDEYRRYKRLTDEWVKNEIIVNQFFLDEAKKKLKN